MATNTSGGTTASLSNTPQAQDDSFNLCEDYSAIAWLDVMGNDLGGNAKILWSLDDSATDLAGATDLITSDIGKVEATSCDTSINGAKIWICDGKVGYDASTLSASFKAQLQALAVGEKTYDSFTYAIRLSNGTLSWGTATVVYTGTNDGPDISVGIDDSASACLTETNSTLSTSGTLTVVDPDTSDTVGVSITGFSKSGNAGTLTDLELQGMLALGQSSLAANAGSANNLDWSFASNPQTFDYLADGECLTLTYTVSADDGHTGTDTQTITVTIKGTNDGPASVSGGTLNGGVEEESGTYTASGSFGFTDVDSSDVHSVSVTSDTTGFLGTLTPSVSNDSTGDGSGTVSWSFSVSNDDLQFLGEGETRTQNYTVTVDDGHGGTTSQTVQIVLTGDEDPIVITSAAQSKSISEDGTSVGGTIAFKDVDLSDTHTASAAANAANTTSLGTFSIDASVTEAANAETGSIGWSYAVDNDAAQYLAAGESVEEKYDVTFNDAHGSIVTETVTVTITGSNDGPDIRVEAGDSAGNDFDETDSGLSTSGTLTVTDPDNSDTIDTSVTVAVSGNQGTLSDDDLLAMFGITGGTDANLAADTADANNLNWSFDSGSEAFDFLAEDEVLTLTYTLTSDDGNGGTDTQDVVITITGTNDAASIAGDVSGDVTESGEDGPGTPTATGDLSSVDVDNPNDSFQVVSTATASDGGYGTFTVDSHGVWSYTLDNTNPDVQALNDGDPLEDTFTVYSIDGTAQQITVTIHGDNDLPFVSGDLLADVTEAGNSNGGGDPTATGTLTADDVDNPDNVFQAGSGNSTNGYGTFTVDADGNWTYTLDNGNDDVQALNDGDTLTDYFTVLSDDGTPTQVQITIHGATDEIAKPITYTGNDDLNNFDDKNDQASGTNLITGTTGDDLALNGNNSANTIRALGGNDTVNANGGGDTVYGGDGVDTIHGGAGNDSLYGQRGNDFLYGEDNNDEIYGGSGNDYIDGGDNSDMKLYGGSGDDTILGGANADTLIGGFGADTLTGGLNSDTFVYLDVRDTNDTITDYTPGPDTISLTGIDANQIQAGDQAFAWGGTDPTAFGLWFTDDGTDTVLYGDTDGDLSTAEFMITLQNFSGFDPYADPSTPPPTTWLGL